MPYVQERVEGWFGRTPRIDFNPDEVVAVGAAILATMLTGKDAKRPPPPTPKAPAIPRLRTPVFSNLPSEIPAPPPIPEPVLTNKPHTQPPLPAGPAAPMAPSVFPMAPEGDGPLLIDVTPLSLSIEVLGGGVDQVIGRNTAVPCQRTRRFATSMDNQRELVLRVCQGEDTRAANNTSIGELVMTELPPARRGDLWIEVTFQLDADGILNVSAKDETAGREVKAQMRIGGAD
jgi:molecular chaperone DnaK (HSP70)